MPIDWPTYTAPPTPAATSDAATWANYLAHVRIQDDRLRFDAKLESDAASTAAQNARAAAEHEVAEAGKANAAALQAAAGGIADGGGGVSEATLLSALEIVGKRE